MRGLYLRDFKNQPRREVYFFSGLLVTRQRTGINGIQTPVGLLNINMVIEREVLVSLLLLASIVLPLYIVLYRLFFSPLSKLPGPWQTRISTHLEVNALREQRRTKWVSELFEENPGAVAVRTGPTSVSFNHPDAVKAIYGKQIWSSVFLDS